MVQREPQQGCSENLNQEWQSSVYTGRHYRTAAAHIHDALCCSTVEILQVLAVPLGLKGILIA